MRVGQEHLGHHRGERERELRTNLRLLVRWKHVDDAVDRLHGRVGVKRAHDQVARLGDGERRLHRLEIAHLTEQHHIGILAQGVLERRLERSGVAPTSRWLITLR